MENWLNPLSTEVTNEILLDLASRLSAKIADGGLRSRIDQHIASADLRALCDLEIDYTVSDRESCRCARQIRAFFEKRRDLDLGVDRQGRALEVFSESEDACRETNRLFLKRSQGSFSFEPCVEQVLFLAQQKITAILGELPNLSDLRFRFGPGATTSVKKKNAAPRVKLGTPFACSSELAPYVDAILGECPGWIPFGNSDSTHVPVEIHFGRLTTVPKSWKTDRTICVEPVLNSFVQLGIGDYMADRLRLVGQDIRNQKRNQLGALMGSVHGGLATLDLSSASDCISRAIVWDLLPFDWASSLEAMSTGDVIHPDGTLLRLQKFSTMGNGFTFPLETLIFYGLTYGVCKTLGLPVEDIQVYGDDIIVPTAGFELLKKTLHVVGFKTNTAKSFSSGPFRESCGADYYSGINIRPAYVKDALSGQSIYVLHNFFRRFGDDELADELVKVVPEHLRLYGPDGYGDGCLIPPLGVVPNLEPFNRAKGWGGYTFDVFCNNTRSLRHPCLPGDRFLPAYHVYVCGTEGNFTPLFTNSDGEVSATPILGTNQYRYSRESLVCTLPGVHGYKRIKIYTLAP